jgi:hypothetical protein
MSIIIIIIIIIMYNSCLSSRIMNFAHSVHLSTLLFS